MKALAGATLSYAWTAPPRGLLGDAVALDTANGDKGLEIATHPCASNSRTGFVAHLHLGILDVPVSVPLRQESRVPRLDGRDGNAARLAGRERLGVDGTRPFSLSPRFARIDRLVGLSS